LSAALLAAALAHTPEAQQVLDGARMRMARKPSALARELLRNFPKGKRKRGGRRRRRKGGGDAAEGADDAALVQAQETNGDSQEQDTSTEPDTDAADSEEPDDAEERPAA
jgi:hypothetical protein